MFGCEGKRRPHFEGLAEFTAKLEAARCNTDDDVVFAVDRKCFIDQIGSAAKPSEPETIADDHDAIAARLAIFSCEVAPLCNADAERRKETCADTCTPQALRIALSGQIGLPPR